jgi:AraC family transcriptional regulator
MARNAEFERDDFKATIQTLYENKELLAQLIESFPFSIQIYDPNGTSILVNKAMLSHFKVIDPSLIIGKYNIFKDPDILSSGFVHLVKRAFRGETVFFSDVRVPLEGITDRYQIHDMDVKALYQDISLFLVFDDENNVICVVALLINKRVYQGKEEIEKAKEYIENRWMEKFDLREMASMTGLSIAHFSKLFKRHTDVTPYEYYICYKINKIKEKLLDANLTVTQAFTACNMKYNGHSAKLFKDRVGVSPSEFRKMSFS